MEFNNIRPWYWDRGIAFGDERILDDLPVTVLPVEHVSAVEGVSQGFQIQHRIEGIHGRTPPLFGLLMRGFFPLVFGTCCPKRGPYSDRFLCCKIPLVRVRKVVHVKFSRKILNGSVREMLDKDGPHSLI